MARYGVNSSDTNTAGDTLGYYAAPATTPGRATMYELIIGAPPTPADQASEYEVRPITNENATPGGSAVTPVPLDVGDRAALYNAVGGAITGEPTGTTSVMGFGLNQRATFRWVASPGSGFVTAAAEDNGMSLFPVATTSAHDVVWTILYEE